MTAGMPARRHRRGVDVDRSAAVPHASRRVETLRLVLALAAAWLVIAAVIQVAVVPRLRAGPRRDPPTVLVWLFVRLFCRLVHGLRWRGDPSWPGSGDDRTGVIVVANHTGSIDPFLVQAACPFFIRWMMASNMMSPRCAGLWRFVDVIPVDRDGRDMAALREAIRTVRAGGAVGVFPEGRIVAPPRELRPFLPGVGMIAAATGAPVLIAWIRGTRDTVETLPSLLGPSRARIEFLGPLRFERDRPHAEIAETLRSALAERSGWPCNDEPMPPLGADDRPEDGVAGAGAT